MESKLCILVCGGRDHDDPEFIYDYLDELNETYGIIALVHGDAKGADRIAGEWARTHRVKEIACPADWAGLGRKAGPIRNQYMLDNHKIDLVVAFKGGRGTAGMVKKALAAGLEVLEPEGD